MHDAMQEEKSPERYDYREYYEMIEFQDALAIVQVVDTRSRKKSAFVHIKLPALIILKHLSKVQASFCFKPPWFKIINLFRKQPCFIFPLIWPSRFSHIVQGWLRLGPERG